MATDIDALALAQALIRRPSVTPKDAGALDVRRAVNDAGGGHATLFRADDAVRAATPVFQPQEAALSALSRRVKESFDPLHILNPGRMEAGV